MLLNQIKNLWQKLISKLIKLKARMKNIDKTKRSKQVDVLTNEIFELYKHIFIVREITYHSNSKFDVYKKYNTFFYSIYYSSHNEIIYGISRLIDQDKKSLSIINLLKEGIEKNDELSPEEDIIYKQLTESDVPQKIKKLRNKLGRAHLDNKISINPEKQKQLYEQNKYVLEDIIKYVLLLKEGVEIISYRSDIPTGLSSTYPNINNEICDIFEKLSK